MQLSKLPYQEAVESAVRQAWPLRRPSDDLSARSLIAALHAVRRTRSKDAGLSARRLATALCTSAVAMAILVMLMPVSVSSSAPVAPLRWVIGSLMTVISIGGCAVASVYARRWCITMDMPMALRWTPMVSVAGIVVVCACLLSAINAPAAQQQSTELSAASMPDHLQTSLDLVSRALTHTMSVSESQAWLDARLPASIDRAWYVTPEGMVALSSITTANEISRSVMDFIAISQTWPATLTAMSDRGIAASAILRNSDVPSRALMYSNTPLLLLVMVKQALQDLSPARPSTQVATQIVRQSDGALAGVAAVSWRPAVQTEEQQSTLLALGVVALCMPWAIWAFLINLFRRTEQR